MIGPTYRMVGYTSKVTQERLLADLTVLIPDMVTRFAGVTPLLTTMELAVKQVCDTAGVPTISYPGYLGFGRELFKKQARQDFSGESLAQFAAVVMAKWAARGLTQAVLTSIRNDVFAIPAPAAP